MISGVDPQDSAVVVGAHWLIEMQFTTGTVRRTTAPIDVVALGNTWAGTGGALEVGDMTESASGSTDKLQISLNIVDTAMIAASMGSVETYRGRPVLLYLQLLNEAFVPVGTPKLRWRGYMEPVQIERSARPPGEDGQSSGRIVLPCSRAGLARSRNATGLRLTYAQQVARYSDDLGLRYVRQLIEKPALWLSKRFQQQ